MRGERWRVPGVAHPGRAPDGSRSLSPDPHRRAARLDREDRRPGTAHAVEPPLDVDLVAAPHRADDPQRLLEPGHPRPRLHPERVELVGAVAEPHPEHRPAVAQDVEGGHLFRDVDRVDHRQQDDPGRGAHRRSDRRQVGQPRNRLVVAQLRTEEVLAAHHEVEPELLGGAHQLLVLMHLLARVDARVVDRGEQDPEPHDSAPRGVSSAWAKGVCRWAPKRSEQNGSLLDDHRTSETLAARIRSSHQTPLTWSTGTA